MAATQNRDMGSGSIPKLLAQLALPAVVAQVVNLLYNIVDRIYIGKLPGKALWPWPAGVCFPIVTLVTAFANLFGHGRLSLFSIERGRGTWTRPGRLVATPFPCWWAPAWC